MADTTDSGTQPIVIPNPIGIVTGRTQFIRETAARIFANMNFDTAVKVKSIKQCADDAVAYAKTLADSLEITD